MTPPVEDPSTHNTGLEENTSNLAIKSFIRKINKPPVHMILGGYYKLSPSVL